MHDEHPAAAWCRETGGTVAALRFHNVYGPGAVVAALDRDLPPGVTAPNVGSPEVTTIGGMAAEMSRLLGGSAPVVTGQYRLGDVRHITADCRAAGRVLGWRAVRPLSSLAELAGP